MISQTLCTVIMCDHTSQSEVDSQFILLLTSGHVCQPLVSAKEYDV